ncbi:MAG: serine/threonine-protein kinase [Candidatus Acidiferrum sp.]
MVEDPSDKNRPQNSIDPLNTVTSGKYVPEDAQPPGVPQKIGRYRILRVLGEGGMGTVYEAEQDQPRRSVALKVIKAAWASPQLLQRFERESQALGRLHHPGIAQIYEAGSAETPMGLLPFFAMELIRGEPLTIYAAKHKLPMRERLALMIQICEAVQHAHQRGIIHRDLKPGNILVDETGQPKILDFGLARATDSDTEVTRQTDVGQLLGTLQYMSPEQVLADPLALDTRSDVYALGVILYELLSGKLPYDLPRQLHEATRTIQEVDPNPLSSVNRVYRGDVETIAAKALEKDKTRRYASAADLAADIRRYLDDQPIQAKPASASYQLQKFARRHKTLVTGVAAVFVVLVGGVVVSTREAIRARRAEHNAQQQTEIARAVNDFLQNDLLAQASAYSQAKPDPDMKVRTALDRAAQNIGGKFDKQPEVEAAIRKTIGSTYTDLGLYTEGRKQLERALELDKKVFGAENQKTIETMLLLADAEEAEGKYPEAEALAKLALELSRRALGPEHPLTIDTMNRLVSIDDEVAKYADGEALGKQAMEISERVNGTESKQTADALYFLAIMEYELTKFAESEKLNKQAMEVRQRLYGPDHPATLNAMNNLAATYAEEGKYTEAISLNKQLVESRSRVLGPEHPDTLDAMVNLGWDYRAQKKFAEAEASDRQVLEIQKRVLGPEHPNTLRSMHNLADDLRAQGHTAEAQSLDLQTLELQKKVLGLENPDTLWTMSSLAMDYRQDHKYEQAAALDEKTAEGRAKVLGPKHPLTAHSMNALAKDYTAMGDYAKAEGVYSKACEMRPESATAFNRLAWFLLTAPDAGLRRPREALDLSRKSLKLAGDNAGPEYNTLGLALIRNKLWEEAVETLNKSAKFNKQADPGDFFLLALAEHGRGNKADAELHFNRAVELARKTPNLDPDTREFWSEAAKDLGKAATHF